MFYTTLVGDRRSNRLSRFRVPRGLDIADPDTETILIDQLDEHDEHNGGSLQFGPDGYLYVSVGDEGGETNQFGNAQ